MNFQQKKMNGQEVKMEEYKDKVILIDIEGKVVIRYYPITKPLKIKNDILKLLNH